MHLSLEKKAAVEVSTRVKARLLDAMRMHYQKAEVMIIMRSFAKWRQAAVLDKSNTTFVEVIASSHTIHLTSSHLIGPHLMASYLISHLFSHLIP